MGGICMLNCLQWVFVLLILMLNINNAIAGKGKFRNRARIAMLARLAGGRKLNESFFNDTTEVDRDPLATTCKGISPESSMNVSLKCYDCRSNTKLEKDPKCDTSLWKHLRHSEKAGFRVTCDRLRGRFCIKIVYRRYLERITERGCFTDSIIGRNGTIVKAQTGCVTYNKNGFITTVCFCDKSFCNGSRKSNIEVTFLISVGPFVVLMYLKQFV